MIALAKRIAASKGFDNTIIALILFTAAIIALEAFPEWMTTSRGELFDILHKLVLAAFIV